MNQNTLTLRDGNLANTQVILQKIDGFQKAWEQRNYDKLLAENSSLKNAISQSNQNQYISATVQANVAPINSRLNNIDTEIAQFKCTQLPTAPVPYFPGQPIGFCGGFNGYNNGNDCGCGC